jgi:hypothetical protein
LKVGNGGEEEHGKQIRIKQTEGGRIVYEWIYLLIENAVWDTVLEATIVYGQRAVWRVVSIYTSACADG